LLTCSSEKTSEIGLEGITKLFCHLELLVIGTVLDQKKFLKLFWIGLWFETLAAVNKVMFGLFKQKLKV
jgi:hypothetical protein